MDIVKVSMPSDNICSGAFGWQGYVVVDLQNICDPRYGFAMDLIDIYKNDIGASEPQQDFYDRHDMYAMWVFIS